MLPSDTVHDFGGKLAREMLGPQPAPERPTMLEAEIEAAIVSHSDPKAAARRILKIERIRQALFLLDQREAGR
jgi:hypothetical protein